MNFICTVEQKESDELIRFKIEAKLLNEANLADCSVLIKKAQAAVYEIILYYVPRGPVNVSHLQELVRQMYGREQLTVHAVPLYRIPLDADGVVDERALMNVAMLDERFIDCGEDMLMMQHGTRQVALLRIPLKLAEEPRYHLNDILPPVGERPVRPALGKSIGKPVSSAAMPAQVSGGILNRRDELQHATLLDVLRAAVERHAHKSIRWVSSTGEVAESSYAQLWEQAERIYAGLWEAGVKPGEKLVFQLHDNASILAAFWACHMGGFIPVMMEVPTGFQPGNQLMERVLGVLRLLKFPLMIADDAAASDWSGVAGIPENQSWRLCRLERLLQSVAHPEKHHASPDDVALFNLSSGSTGIPKCIMLSHRNLLARAYGTNQLCNYSAADIILNWLPFDHIGSISDWHIRCVVLGCELIYVEKDYVLTRPLNWLHLMNRYRATHSWAPNFAFTLIAKQLSAATDQEWDLSCIQCLLTAGEAVSDSSVHEFVKSLSRFGLAANAIHPAFGMAELCSGITYAVAADGRAPRFHSIRKPANGDIIERLDDNHPDATRFADLGPVIPGVSIRIVDNQNHLLPMEAVGRLQVKGEVVFQGYYANTAANTEAFQSDGWFNTGDLGFITQGHLVLTGREKETIIIKGANYYSHEIEDSVTQVNGVLPSYTAACGVRRRLDSEEKLAVFFVPAGASDELALIRTIRTQVTHRFGITPAYVIPLTQQLIPKTAIGKIQRTQLKQRLESGEFDEQIKHADLLLANDNTLPAWFYRPIWRPKKLSGRIDYQHPPSGVVLVVMGDTVIGKQLLRKLEEQQRPAVSISSGLCFDSSSNAHFQLNMQSKDDFSQLFHHLHQRAINITQIVSLVDYQQVTTADYALDEDDPINVSVFLALLQAVLETGANQQLKRLLWVSSDAHTVQAEEVGSATAAMMASLMVTLRTEHPDLECSCIDLPSQEGHANVAHLMAELTGFSKEPLIAYRHYQRYVSRLEKINLAQKARYGSIQLKQGGHYLITGGLGGLGFELCRRLGRQYQAKLVIIGRRALETANIDEEVEALSVQQRLQALRDENIECCYVQADVADLAAVETQLLRIEETWQHSVEGVFHLAGVAGERALQEETLERFTALTRAKRLGTVVLGDLIKARPNAFLLVFSSVNAYFGGRHVGSYAAANAFANAYCSGLRHAGLPAYCYGWSLWEDIGMSAAAATIMAAAKGFYPLSLEAGLNSLMAMLNAGYPEALIGLDATKEGVRTRLNDCAVERETVYGFVEKAGAEGAEERSILLQDCFGNDIVCHYRYQQSIPKTEDGTIDKDSLLSQLRGDNQATQKPKNAIETKLAELWCEVLQVSQIGTQDNFFEMGGDSLLVVQLVGRIEQAFNQRVPASALFHAPTITQLADLLTQDKPTSGLFSLVPIKQGNSKPLYIIQSDSWEFVRYLDAEQSVYGLNYGVGADSLERKLKLPDSLEDLASHFIEEIQAVQPEGPYLLVGHSNAGLLAYEMARQLVMQGKVIGLLGMIDTRLLQSHSEGQKTSKWTKLTHLARTPLPKQLGLLRGWSEYQMRRIRLKYFTAPADVPFLNRAMNLYRQYQPKPYAGKITYFKCTKQSRFDPVGQHEMKWEKLAQQGLDVHDIPCHHDEVLFDPHVKLVVDSMSRYLQ